MIPKEDEVEALSDKLKIWTQFPIRTAVKLYKPQEIINSTEERDIDIITEKILFHKKQAGASFIEIGKLLNEAKDKLKHGQWLPWLIDNVEISEITAQRLMRIAKEYTNPATVTDLGFSKAFTLLTLEIDKREEFIAALHEVDGVQKSVYEMTKRELKKVMGEYNKNSEKESEAQKKHQKESKSIYDEPIKVPYETTKDFEVQLSQLKSLQICIDTIIDNINTLKENPNDYDILSAELRSLRKKMLSIISEILNQKFQDSS